MCIRSKRAFIIGVFVILVVTIYSATAAPSIQAEKSDATTQQISDKPVIVEGVTKVFPSSQVRTAHTTQVDANMSEDFEGDWPAPGWELLNPDSDKGREYLWGKRDCQPHSGNMAGWSIGGGAQGSDLLCSDNYPNNVQSSAFYGPFDLSTASTATLTYHVWGRSELEINGCVDALFVASSIDRQKFKGSVLCGTFTNGDAGNGYYQKTLDLSERLGESQVWIVFAFVSNGSTTYAGFTIDDIALDVTDNPPLTVTATSMPNTTVTPEPTLNWKTEIVDSVGDVGKYSSLALDDNNNVHISYYDESNGDLKYAKQSDDSWLIETVDRVGDVGKYSSLALGDNNNVHISYYDESNGDLKYAIRINGHWTISTMDSTGDVGRYTSLALDSYSQVHIGYHDDSNIALKHAKSETITSTSTFTPTPTATNTPTPAPTHTPTPIPEVTPTGQETPSSQGKLYLPVIIHS